MLYPKWSCIIILQCVMRKNCFMSPAWSTILILTDQYNLFFCVYSPKMYYWWLQFEPCCIIFTRILLIDGETFHLSLRVLLVASRSNLIPNSTLQDQSGVETQLKTQLLPSTTSTTCYQSKAAKPSVSVPPRCLYHTNANSISPSGLIRVLKQLLLL